MTIAAGLALAASSCIYEYDKCPPALTLKIENDWQAAPEADPEGMAYMFFQTLAVSRGALTLPGVRAVRYR